MKGPVVDPFVGTTLAQQYHIERLLGTGGMGSVYLARDDKREINVAVKILHPTLSRDDRHVKRFLREVQLTRKVHHPNVVQIFDVGQHKGHLFFSMEYVEGVSLKEKLSKGTLPSEEIINSLSQVCAGLHAIHEIGIVHRDLKPGNILRSESFLKIADLGIARPQGADLALANEIVGSVAYMSPELWRGDEIDATTDIYSLGVMLYEMIVGSKPFTGESSTEMMHHHLYTPPPSPVSSTEEIPTWLGALTLMMLEKEQMKRPQSALEVLSIIESATHAIAFRGGATGAHEAQSKSTSGKAVPGGVGRAAEGDKNVGLSKQEKDSASRPRAVDRVAIPQGGRKRHMTGFILPEVPNPGYGLLTGVLTAGAILLFLLGPYLTFLDEAATLHPLDSVSWALVISLNLTLALGISLLVAIPSLIFASLLPSYRAQLLAYLKHAALAFGLEE